jgi:hypothetical protein
MVCSTSDCTPLRSTQNCASVCIANMHHAHIHNRWNQFPIPIVWHRGYIWQNIFTIVTAGHARRFLVRPLKKSMIFLEVRTIPYRKYGISFSTGYQYFFTTYAGALPHVLTSCVYSLFFQYNVFLSVLYDAPSYLPVWAKLIVGHRV